MGLFSTTKNYNNKTEYNTKLVPYEKTVYENKAPTDESIRLLNEFQEKATLNILNTIKVEDNFINAVSIFLHNKIVTDQIDVYIRFTLNGQDFYIDSYIKGNEFKEMLNDSSQSFEFGRKIILQFIYKKFSEMVAEELVKQDPTLIKNITLMHKNNINQ